MHKDGACQSGSPCRKRLLFFSPIPHLHITADRNASLPAAVWRSRSTAVRADTIYRALFICGTGRYRLLRALNLRRSIAQSLLRRGALLIEHPKQNIRGDQGIG